MSSKPRLLTMALLGLTLLVSVVMSSYHPHASSRSRALTGRNPTAEQLRRLVEKLQGSSARRWPSSRSKETSYGRRTIAAEGDCTADIIRGYQWDGDEIMSAYGIDSAQRCMDNCDVNKNCMGWSFKPESRMCWGTNNIRGIREAEGVESGSCIGMDIKTECTENTVGWYPGAYESAGEVQSADECMNQCSEESTCFGWYYMKWQGVCHFSRAVGSLETQYDWVDSGSCIATQERKRVADPQKVFRAESLDRHNEKRKMHCAPDLELDDDLNQAAQEFAEQLADADDTPPDYDISTMQTVFFNAGNPTVHGGVIVDNFYDEGRYYNYEEPDFAYTSHFPKVIWKSSTKLGVGRAFTSDNGTMFIVTKYDWEGDMTQSYQDNVQRKCE